MIYNLFSFFVCVLQELEGVLGGGFKQGGAERGNSVGGWNKILTLTAFQILFSHYGVLIMSNGIKYNKVQTLLLALQSTNYKELFEKKS